MLALPLGEVVCAEGVPPDPFVSVSWTDPVVFSVDRDTPVAVLGEGEEPAGVLCADRDLVEPPNELPADVGMSTPLDLPEGELMITPPPAVVDDASE